MKIFTYFQTQISRPCTTVLKYTWYILKFMLDITELNSCLSVIALLFFKLNWIKEKYFLGVYIYIIYIYILYNKCTHSARETNYTLYLTLPRIQPNYKFNKKRNIYMITFRQHATTFVRSHVRLKLTFSLYTLIMIFGTRLL